MQMATRILFDMGRILGADRLIPVTSSHIDGCLYHGDSGVDFAEMLVKGGGRVCVPTTLNVGGIDLLRPASIKYPAHQREMALRLMKAYIALGCTQTWTCAPYQDGHRPQMGEDVAWAESNAVVFANSVLGARTNRYGDFLDICAALTGRAPHCGLHLLENRRATVLIRTGGLSEQLKRQPVLYPVLGAWLGRNVGSSVAAIDGIPEDTPEDFLKALGASAASAGAVGLFHVIGVTPEARTINEAFGGKPPALLMQFGPHEVRSTRDTLSNTDSESMDLIALGSPHYSLQEVDRFEALRAGRELKLPVYICLSRLVWSILDANGRAALMEASGVRFVTDTCVVVTPILPQPPGILMTDSGKFAHYTPGNTSYHVRYGSISECVETAVQGRVVRDEALWQ
jgi:predicted aconitase